MKRFLFVLSMLLLMVCLIPETAITASAESDGVFTYTVADGKATITDCIDSATGELIIPDTLGGYPVTAIAEGAFAENTGITAVTIADSVTDLGIAAFRNCTGLTDLRIGKGLSRVGVRAFDGCTGLTRINFNATQMKDLYGGNGVFGNAGVKADGITVVIGANVKCIPSYLFAPFADFSEMPPDPDEDYFTPNIKTVTFEEGSTCNQIGHFAFYRCTPLQTITFPESLTTIDYRAFEGCSGLKSIVIPPKMQRLSMATFGDCSALESVYLPDGFESLGESTFYNCTSLKTIRMPDSLSIIGFGVFSNCSALTELTIPENVTVIGEWAFNRCTGLTRINFNATQMDVIYNAFFDAGIDGDGITVTVGANVTKIPEYMFYEYDGFEDKLHSPNITNVLFEEGSVCAGIGNRAFASCSRLTTIALPDSLASIGEDAFNGCKGLVQLTVPNSVTEIGIRAFSNCSGLRTVKLSNGISTIGYSVFLHCTGLESIIIPDGVTFIDMQAFGNCDALTSVAIPNSVVTLNNYAFSHCDALTTVAVGTGVTTIGEGVFEECYNLNRVIYCGTPAQWAQISISDFNAPLTALTPSYHDFIEASCTIPGTCAICGATQDAAPGHAYGDWVELLSATCTTDGIKARMCGSCGDTQTEAIPALGHQEGPSVRPPTCTEQGIFSSICPVCGEVEDEMYVPALGHEWSDWDIAVLPTCTEQGYDESTCTRCAEVRTRYTSALGHKWRTWTTTVQPTCTEQGCDESTCMRCSEKRIMYIPALGHKWSAWITTVQPSCTQEGSWTRFCNCGTRETELLAKLPHSIADGSCSTCGAVMAGFVKLTEDLQVTGLTLKEDLYIDLNGFRLTGTVITNGYEIYGMDSTTDDYTCADIGYFNCVDENGQAIVPVRQFSTDITGTSKRYMAIEGENGYSFHRFFLGVTHMSMKPSANGVGYKAVFYGDDMVAGELESYGYSLWFDGYAKATGSKSGDSFVSGKTVTLRIDGFDAENFGEKALHAAVTMTLKDGTVIESSEYTMTLRGLVEAINEKVSSLTTTQIQAIADMIKRFAVMQSWKVENLYS